ncbi:PREDICTED: calvin cycle protein CP12-3, chloroplastic [Prunus mume]|uniref:Calvin cycle protein CP12-3, chloroplastic n=1 Tax=Prunus mume TaxID=102107 RepID=A0ABM0PD48_PRUMU|nr:PREDICTED: calvin cycle protein CP12-3, chloroplastic [Prunus mume]
MACLSGGSGSGVMCLSETYLKKKLNDLSSPSSSSLCLRSDNNNKNRMIKCGTKSGGVQGKFKGTQMREKQLTEMIEKKVMEAKQVCEGDPIADECKVAWDEVEEVSQAKADLRLKLETNKDPLESFCQDNPETDECRIYED